MHDIRDGKTSNDDQEHETMRACETSTNNQNHNSYDQLKFWGFKNKAIRLRIATAFSQVGLKI